MFVYCQQVATPSTLSVDCQNSLKGWPEDFLRQERSHARMVSQGFSRWLIFINFIIIMCTCHLTSLAHTYCLRRRICMYVGGSFVTICSWINYVRSLMYMYGWISTLIDRPWVPVGDVGERRGRGNFGNRNCIILTSINQKVATVVEESSYIVVVRVLYNFPCSVSSWAGFHTEGGGGRG